jgi:hypothetical protein
MVKTKEQCLAEGGHCWVEDPYSTINNAGRTYGRGCKHCSARQWGTDQPKIAWKDVPERER